MHPRVSASLRRRLVARCNRRVTDQRQNDDSRSAPLPQRCGTMYRGLIRRSSDMRSSNPVLRDKTFSGQHAEGEVMTMDGMVGKTGIRSEEHTSELQSLMRISYAVFCLKKKKTKKS